jgi:hypothetical protein
MVNAQPGLIRTHHKELAMKTTGALPRLPFAYVIPLLLSLALVALAALRPWVAVERAARAVPGGLNPHAVVVDGAAASRLAAEHPWASVGALAQPRAVIVDGAAASRLAAEHPWTSGLPLATVTVP